MRAFLIFLLAAGLAGCSLVGTDKASDVRLTNSAKAPIVFLAWEREATNTLDPNPELSRAEYADHIVEPGATTDVEPIEGGWEKGDDLRLFIYAAPEGAETATLAKVLDVSAEELQRQNYNVSVESL